VVLILILILIFIKVVDRCLEWRTSKDGQTWERRGILTNPSSGPSMDETMSARVYGEQLVLMTDGKGTVAFVTDASALNQDDPAAMVWTPGVAVNSYSGLNRSFVNVALRVLPVDSHNPTHAMAPAHEAARVPRGHDIRGLPTTGRQQTLDNSDHDRWLTRYNVIVTLS